MRSEARLYTRRNDDPDWIALPIGPQWAFDLVLSQEDLEHHGVIALRPARWARQADGITEQQLTGYLQLLHERRFVVVDDKYGELLVRSLLRQDKVYKQPNVLRSAAIRLSQVKSPAIREALHAELLRIAELDDLSEPCRLIVKEMQEATAPGAPVSSNRPARRPRSTPTRSAKPADNRTVQGSANPSRKGSASPSHNAAAGPSPKAGAYRPPNPDASASANPSPGAAAGDGAEPSGDRSPIPRRKGSGNPSPNPSGRSTSDGQSPSTLAATTAAEPVQPKPLGGWDFTDLEAATVAVTDPWLATLAVPPTDQLLEDIEYQISSALIAGHQSEHIAEALAAWHACGSTDPSQFADLIDTPAPHGDAQSQTRDTSATPPPASADEWLAIAKADR